MSCLYIFLLFVLIILYNYVDIGTINKFSVYLANFCLWSKKSQVISSGVSIDSFQLTFWLTITYILKIFNKWIILTCIQTAFTKQNMTACFSGYKQRIIGVQNSSLIYYFIAIKKKKKKKLVQKLSKILSLFLTKLYIIY